MNDKLDHPYDADERGFFGDFGGRFMPEALVAALDELTEAWHEAMADPAFLEEFRLILREYAGVPSPLYLAERLSEQVGATILLKREDLNHTASTAWPAQRPRPTSASTAPSTWARST